MFRFFKRLIISVSEKHSRWIARIGETLVLIGIFLIISVVFLEDPRLTPYLSWYQHPNFLYKEEIGFCFILIGTPFGIYARLRWYIARYKKANETKNNSNRDIYTQLFFNFVRGLSRDLGTFIMCTSSGLYTGDLARYRRMWPFYFRFNKPLFVFINNHLWEIGVVFFCAGFIYYYFARLQHVPKKVYFKGLPKFGGKEEATTLIPFVVRAFLSQTFGVSLIGFGFGIICAAWIVNPPIFFSTIFIGYHHEYIHFYYFKWPFGLGILCWAFSLL